MGTAQLIREHRTKAGLTQAELAKAAGTSQPTIAKYEAARAEPRADTLARILAACGAALSSQPTETVLTRIPARGPHGRLIRRRREEIIRLIERAGLANPRVFGSVARGEDTADSDIDLLVDLETTDDPFMVGVVSEELSDLLGIHTDVFCPQLMKPGVLEEAHRDAIPL